MTPTTAPSAPPRREPAQSVASAVPPPFPVCSLPIAPPRSPPRLHTRLIAHAARRSRAGPRRARGPPERRRASRWRAPVARRPAWEGRHLARHPARHHGPRPTASRAAPRRNHALRARRVRHRAGARWNRVVTRSSSDARRSARSRVRGDGRIVPLPGPLPWPLPGPSNESVRSSLAACTATGARHRVWITARATSATSSSSSGNRPREGPSVHDDGGDHPTAPSAGARTTPRSRSPTIADGRTRTFSSRRGTAHRRRPPLRRTARSAVDPRAPVGPRMHPTLAANGARRPPSGSEGAARAMGLGRVAARRRVSAG